MPDDIDILLDGPLFCAALLAAQEWGYSAADVTKPSVSFALCVAAREAVNPWDGDYDATIHRILARRKNIRSFAKAVLNQPGLAWWSSPLAKRSQARVSGHLADSAGIISSTHAQSPIPVLVTSTYMGGDTCWDALTSEHVGDEEPDPSPTRTLLDVDSNSRVFEIDSAESWYELVQRYPFPSPGAERGSMSPDWQAVAQDWDGVHLSLMGFLAGTHVPVGSGHERTTLWTWDGEQTRWFRDVFSSTTQVPAASHKERAQHSRRPLRFLDPLREGSPASRPLARD